MKKDYLRPIVNLGLAALLPIIVFVAIQFIYAAKKDREQVQADAMAHVMTIMSQVDAELEKSQAFLRLMASSVSLDQQNYADYYVRIQRAIKVEPKYVTLILWDARNHTGIFDVRQPLPSAKASWPFQDFTFQSNELVVSGIEASPESARPLLFIHYPVVRDEQLRYVLSLAIDPQVFQNILLANSPSGMVGAVVDQSGRFIGRTLHYQERVGQLATVFVRQAISDGAQGIYPGKTYEGLENFTAFYKSSLTGWSVHLAFSSAIINGARNRSIIVAAVAAIGTILLGGLLGVLALRDMHERRRIDLALHQAQKMEAIGQLTGSIAHDFNNLLMVASSGLELMDRSNDPVRQERLKQGVRQAVERGARLTRQLLAFARRSPMSPEVMDLGVRLRDMQDMLDRALREDIIVEVKVAADLWPVEVDPSQFEVAILNIALNARDAMPNGGVITMTLSNQPAHSRSDKNMASKDMANKDMVSVVIADTGMGMPAALIERVFEPFFTTKGMGQGTGLGLSQVYGFAQSSGGQVTLSSEEGHGTRLNLLLPRSRRSVTLITRPATPENTATVTQRRRILMVEDDDGVAMMVMQMLEKLGYEVTRAANAAAALTIIADDHAFAVVLSDMVMPGSMDGLGLAQELARLHPELPLVLTTGFSNAASQARQTGLRLLVKPYRLEELARELENAQQDKKAHSS